MDYFNWEQLIHSLGILDSVERIAIALEKISNSLTTEETKLSSANYARWIRVDDWTDECSCCGGCQEEDYENRTPYCPYCGAKMDLESEG